MNAPVNDLLTVDDLVVEYPGKGWRAKPFRVLKGVSSRRRVVPFWGCGLACMKRSRCRCSSLALRP